MEVIWSDLALQQLDAVVDYVEENFGVMTARKSLRKILEKTDELAVYAGHGIYDAKYTSLVADEQMVIRHLFIAPNRIYYLVDTDKVVIMGIVHVRQSPRTVTSMIKRFLEHYER